MVANEDDISRRRWGRQKLLLFVYCVANREQGECEEEDHRHTHMGGKSLNILNNTIQI